MKKIRKLKRQKHTKKIGMAPGALVYVGSQEYAQPNFEPIITLIEYQSEKISERTLSLEELSTLDLDHYLQNKQKIWLNVHGVHVPEVIQKIGDIFRLHPLVLEDILTTHQRPKLDAFGHYLFLEARSFEFNTQDLSMDSEQISFVLGQHFLLTFQERSTGVFEPVRTRLRAEQSQVREQGVDYLAYALLDCIVDRYFNVLEELNDASENLESSLLNKTARVELGQIHQLKHLSVELRRAVWPLREVINSLIRNEHGFFKANTLPYLRDVYDHTVSYIESLESIRDALAALMEIYMANVSQRVNLELRALTVVTMMFMPATLITGIFGMNFEAMPLLKEHDGFWWAIGFMSAIAAMMLLIFARRQWVTRQIFSVDEVQEK
jgi:magnesium transporter